MSRPFFQGLPVVSAAEMRELDRRAVQDFKIPSLALMENAGAAVAREIARRWDLPRLKVLVCCGRGNNGGDGLVIARRLKGRCAGLRVLIAAAKNGGGYGPEVSANLKRALDEKIAVETVAAEAPRGAFDQADLIVDALLGTGASGAPTGAAAAMIEAIEASGKPVAAVDLPSGLDADTGLTPGAVVTAELTATLALPKPGLLVPEAKKYIGELVVADIGLPSEIIPKAP